MNPYSPPAPRLPSKTENRWYPRALLVLGLVAVQLIWVSLYISVFFQLITIGSAHPFAGLGVVAGCVLLLTGAIGFVLNASRGGYPFLGAAVSLGFSLITWRLEAWSYPLVLGIAVAALGWWWGRQFKARAVLPAPVL